MYSSESATVLSALAVLAYTVRAYINNYVQNCISAVQIQCTNGRFAYLQRIT